MIIYKHTKEILAVDVARVFKNSGIRRPHDDIERLSRMVEHADILITAWEDDRMVGITRGITDYSYCCYLSDLAVDQDYQKKGIGQALLQQVRDQLSDEVSLVLLSSPGAMEFYPKSGFTAVTNAFAIKRIC